MYWEMLDLAAARAEWEAEDPQRRADSDLLRPLDHAGRKADFHALRHTTGSWLAAKKGYPKVIQRIMRHTARPVRPTTAENPGDGDRRRAKYDRLYNCRAKCPVHCPVRGTISADDSGLAAGSEAAQGSKRKHRQAQQKRPFSAGQTAFSANEGDETRTRNLRIDSPVL